MSVIDIIIHRWGQDNKEVEEDKAETCISMPNKSEITTGSMLDAINSLARYDLETSYVLQRNQVLQQQLTAVRNSVLWHQTMERIRGGREHELDRGNYR